MEDEQVVGHGSLAVDGLPWRLRAEPNTAPSRPPTAPPSTPPSAVIVHGRRRLPRAWSSPAVIGGVVDQPGPTLVDHRHREPLIDDDAGPSPVRAAIGVGTNRGDRLATIEAALWTLDDTAGMEVVDVSGVWETAPWGGVEQQPYLNAVVLVDTTLSPHDLLVDLQATEAAFGRDRDAEVRWGPRTLDLDVLLYGGHQVDTTDLVIPHPRLVERAFVLVPLLEVMPGGALPDGTRLTTAMTALAPVEGIDLHVRLSDHPGRAHIQRPDGPAAGPAWLSGGRSSDQPARDGSSD